MPDPNPRADALNVESIMEQIRARIREKRGVDSAEQEIHDLATAKLESFLDPAGARSDLIDQLRKVQPAYEPPELPAYEFEDSTIYDSTRGFLRFVRRLLNPILKLFFNPNPLIRALNIQARLNATSAERDAKREAMRLVAEQRQYELLHNLLVEMTRTGMETRNLRMRVESIASRLEFNERRAREIESAVAYKTESDERISERPSRAPVQAPPPSPPAGQPGAPAASHFSTPPQSGPNQPGDASSQRRRRRRRRGRRGGGQPMGASAGVPGGAGAQGGTPASNASSSQTSGGASPDAIGRDDLATVSGAAAHPSEGELAEAPTPTPPVDTDTDTDTDQ
jgi:hypothetical protein